MDQYDETLKQNVPFSSYWDLCNSPETMRTSVDQGHPLISAETNRERRRLGSIATQMQNLQAAVSHLRLPWDATLLQHIDCFVHQSLFAHANTAGHRHTADCVLVLAGPRHAMEQLPQLIVPPNKVVSGVTHQ
eukprot:scaffold142896_cov26-Prasinocladus_malaysianus.AAC.1